MQITEDSNGNMWLLKAGLETTVVKVTKDRAMTTFRVGDAPSFTDVIGTEATWGPNRRNERRGH